MLPQNLPITVGPSRVGTRLKLTPSDGLTPTRLHFEGHEAVARFLLARTLARTEYDPLLKQHSLRLDRALSQPWAVGGDEVMGLLKVAGLTLEYDLEAADLLEAQMGRESSRFSRWYPLEGEDGSLEWRFKPGTIDPHAKQQVAEVLTDLGWKSQLFPYAWDNALEAGTKRDVLLALEQRLGKTRLALCLSEYYRAAGKLEGPTVIIGLKRHIAAWQDQFPGIDILKATYGPTPYDLLLEKGDKPTFKKPFLFLSLERVALMSDLEFEDLRERLRGSTIIVDETTYIANLGAKRTSRFVQLQGKHHLALSGTPSKGIATSLFTVLCWTFRGGSSAFPDFSLHRAGSSKRFEKLFVQYAIAEDGTRRKTPLVKNEEAFHDMLAPLMVRRLRGEPDVTAILGSAAVQEEELTLALGDKHLLLYRAVLSRFQEWYRRKLEAVGRAENIGQTDILAKLGWLITAVSQPWKVKAVVDNSLFEWPNHDHAPTAVQAAAVERAIEETEAGYKTLIFAAERGGLDLMALELQKRGIKASSAHGEYNQFERNQLVKQLRRGELEVLCCSYRTFSEAYDLACASRVLITEYDWNPTALKQAVKRIDGIHQQHEPKVVYYTAEGTIQEYMKKLGGLKSSAMGAALDGRRQLETGDDIPDFRQYAHSLVFGDERDEMAPRKYVLETG